MILQDLLNALYDLEPWEQRRVAWEALLISDGPDRVEGEQGGSIHAICYKQQDRIAFAISDYNDGGNNDGGSEDAPGDAGA